MIAKSAAPPASPAHVQARFRSKAHLRARLDGQGGCVVVIIPVADGDVPGYKKGEILGLPGNLAGPDAALPDFDAVNAVSGTGVSGDMA